jgi:hypothetical protein
MFSLLSAAKNLVRAEANKTVDASSDSKYIIIKKLYREDGSLAAPISFTVSYTLYELCQKQT